MFVVSSCLIIVLVIPVAVVFVITLRCIVSRCVALLCVGSRLTYCLGMIMYFSCFFVLFCFVVEVSASLHNIGPWNSLLLILFFLNRISRRLFHVKSLHDFFHCWIRSMEPQLEKKILWYGRVPKFLLWVARTWTYVWYGTVQY